MAKSSYSLQKQEEHTRYLGTLKTQFLERFSLVNMVNLGGCRNPDSYDIIKCIGRGSFGEVLLVRDKNNMSYHAMKVVEKQIAVEKNHEKHLLTEKRIMSCLNFPFLVSLDFAFKDNVYLYFVLPFVSGGELFTYLQRFGNFSDETSKFFASQIVLAVEYLHSCQVVHRDIKPENILITTKGYLQLGDFGFCKVVKKRTWTLCGTPEYLAPEIVMFKGYSFPVDWWAVGVLIFEMNTGNPPFIASDPTKLYEKILVASYKCPDGMTRDCKSLIKGLLMVDQTKRLGCMKHEVYDIKSHSWFSTIVWEDIFSQSTAAPFKPECATPGDTSNFPDLTEPRLKISSECLCEEEFADF